MAINRVNVIEKREIKETIQPNDSWKSATIGSVTSKDGTIIGYRQVGHGPGVVFLHGAAESSLSHIELAETLANTYTVYLPDRRGRGLSGPYGKDHIIQRDVEDMEVLLKKTGAHMVFGVSSGAVIWLQALLSLPVIEKAVIFEPPLSINGSISMDFLKRYEEEIAQGKTVEALVTGMLGAQMGPPIFAKLPRWLLKVMTTIMINSEDKKAKPDDITMRKLAPTIGYDFRIVRELSERWQALKAIKAEVLLLGGGETRAYLKTSLHALEDLLPNAQRVELPGVGHEVTGNAQWRGKPDMVAPVLRQFFA